MPDNDRKGTPGQSPPRAEAADGGLGGADAVEKTTYSADASGAEVEERKRDPSSVTATVGHEGGLGPLGWVALVLAAVAFLAYAGWIFS
jgi:hypothetical protein